MSDLRSSKQQLKDELDDIYNKMTNPDEIAKTKRNEKRKEDVKEMVEDYGL